MKKNKECNASDKICRDQNTCSTRGCLISSFDPSDIMKNTTKEYQFEGTKGAWMQSEDISGFVRDENGQMHEIFQAFDGKDTSISNMDFGIAKENAKMICLAGNLSQKFDPQTWETRLTQFEEMKTALEKIASIKHVDAGYEECQDIARELLASLTENNGNENFNKD